MLSFFLQLLYMNRRFLDHYNNELHHLRQMAAEFAQQNPVVAGRLALDKEGKEICPDPYVERLLEGFAFLTARVQLKLDAEFPRLTQSLLETVYPQYLCPIPSMAIVRFEPDQQATQPDGYPIPRGTVLRSNLRPGERTACEYRTAHDVQLWPLRLNEARYYMRDVSELDLPPSLGGRAALRFRLQTSGGIPIHAIKLDRLPFFFVEPMNCRAASTNRFSLAERRWWYRLSQGNAISHGQSFREPSFAGSDFEKRKLSFQTVHAAFRAIVSYVNTSPFPSAIFFLK